MRRTAQLCQRQCKDTGLLIRVHASATEIVYFPRKRGPFDAMTKSGVVWFVNHDGTRFGFSMLNTSSRRRATLGGAPDWASG